MRPLCIVVTVLGIDSPYYDLKPGHTVTFAFRPTWRAWLSLLWCEIPIDVTALEEP